jgi:SulP family sulfate permease
VRPGAYVATLLREAPPDFSWKRGVDVRREALAGVVGAVLVIPQAITFAYLVGLSPEAGLYCAVFVGLIASLFGNSPMVGGPNTAVSILLSLTVMQYAGRGSPIYTEFVLVLSLMVGVIQLGIWLLRGAEIFRYFSPAAIIGIKTGVGILLITSALEGVLGLSALSTQFFYEKFYLAAISWNLLVNPYAVATALVTIVSGLALKRIWPRTYIVAAVIAGSVVGVAIYLVQGPVGSQLELLGHVTLRLLPFQIPRLTPQHWLFMEAVVPSAIAIAVLGLAQSLVIARDLKARVVNDLDLEKEVFAQGIANTLSPFFSTFAGSGSFNRTSVAVDMGARTPLAGIVAAGAVVLFAFALGPVLTYLPMPAIAGVLVLVGIGMIQGEEVRQLMRGRVDGIVFLVTLFTVTFLGLDVGILVAVLASAAFLLAGMSKVDFDVSHDGETERIAVKGNLFYASVDRLRRHLHAHPSARTQLDLTGVPFCDATAHAMIRAVQHERRANGGQLDLVPANRG